MTELLNVSLVVVGALLWFLGGKGEDLDTTPQLNKGWRRFVWPIWAGAVCLVNQVPFWAALGVLGALAGVNSLGYGEKKPWWYRIVVGCLLGTPMLLIHATWLWPVATVATFIPLYKWSREDNNFTWPVVETITGGVQGACLMQALNMVR